MSFTYIGGPVCGCPSDRSPTTLRSISGPGVLEINICAMVVIWVSASVIMFRSGQDTSVSLVIANDKHHSSYQLLKEC